jgi:hypothetical protein
MRTRLAFKDSTTTFAHCFNSRGYRTYWYESTANVIISLSVLYETRGGKQEAQQLHCHCILHSVTCEAGNMVLGYRDVKILP